ncbi:type II toxin-antitoxin system VapC family toxin [Cognataquiflexum rubidum]|uniref:type II toxin-antitoxin system VapC family toxin n=1 Tax=Cognataquiflexum rubidum TaxID=2922273 RepID=UPI001F146B03|nr:type II toxin-antitoxin system VapC family toxin [Cognataquiflexum rubidum]MCH6232402.1 type II toxin-antitoxin system VapC family toxin [Cognataquiflexum rubidum]
MGKQEYLIDTNALIDYLGMKLPKKGMSFLNEVVDVVPYLSVISKIELLGFNTTEEQYAILSSFIADSVVFDLSDKVVEKCIELRKKTRIKLPDAIIASTALVYDLKLISRNTSDFNHIKGLVTINPHSI